MPPRSWPTGSSRPLPAVSDPEPGHSPLVRWYFFALLRSQLIARWADSFMTSPNWPVRVSWPSPSIRLASTNMISPPKGVQAKPMATPGWLRRSDTLRASRKRIRQVNKSSHFRADGPKCRGHFSLQGLSGSHTPSAYDLAWFGVTLTTYYGWLSARKKLNFLWHLSEAILP